MQSIDSSPLEPHVGGIWSVKCFVISSFSFCLFLPACFNFQDRGKLQIQRHPEAGHVREVCLHCATLPGTDSPRLLVLRGARPGPRPGSGADNSPRARAAPIYRQKQSRAQVAFLQSCSVRQSMTKARSLRPLQALASSAREIQGSQGAGSYFTVMPAKNVIHFFILL